MSQYQDLQAKLRLLYDSGLVPAIDSHSKLAQELSIRRQNVNKWINGADGYSPGTIPRGSENYRRSRECAVVAIQI